MWAVQCYPKLGHETLPPPPLPKSSMPWSRVLLSPTYQLSSFQCLNQSSKDSELVMQVRFLTNWAPYPCRPTPTNHLWLTASPPTHVELPISWACVERSHRAGACGLPKHSSSPFFKNPSTPAFTKNPQFIQRFFTAFPASVFHIWAAGSRPASKCDNSLSDAPLSG